MLNEAKGTHLFATDLTLAAEWKRVMNDPVELLQYFGFDATKQAGMIETLIWFPTF